MRAADLIKYSLKNAFRRKGRAVLTILAVIIGAFTFTVTSGLGAGVTSYLDSQTASIGAANTIQVTSSASMALLTERLDEYDDALVSAAPGTNAGILSESDLATIEAATGANDVVVTTVQTNPQYIQVPGEQKFRFVYNGYWPEKEVNLEAGSQIDDQDPQPALILPSYAIVPLGFSSADDVVGQEVVVGVLDAVGTVHEITASVVGVQERTLIGGNLPFGNRAFDDELQSISRTGVDVNAAEWYPYALVVSDDVAVTVAALHEAGFAAATAAQSVGDYKSIVDGILLLFNILASIAIAAAMFGIVNTLLMSVQERMRSIGLFRALGMNSRTVFTTVAFEAFALGLFGSVIAVGLGLVAGWGAGPAILQAAALDLPGLSLFEFDALSLATIVLGVTAATVIAALLPAFRAARLNPMAALREEH